MFDNPFYIKYFVDSKYSESSIINHDEIALEFKNKISKLSNDEFEFLLICNGYIPDLYESDSSEETLFSKLVEVIVCEWANRMGFESDYVKQKASYQDVNIFINNRAIVCDAKSFRLGRSQLAPNVKDFLKLEDMRKWIERFPPDKRLGGMVAYPCLHEWKTKSDAYQYCSTKNIPTVMLPYKYLAFILSRKNTFNPNDLTLLWDSYSEMFPESLKTSTKGGNKKLYWQQINSKLISIMGCTQDALNSYLDYANSVLEDFVSCNIQYLSSIILDKISNITLEVNSLDVNKIKQELIDYRTISETSDIQTQIKRIKAFRK